MPRKTSAAKKSPARKVPSKKGLPPYSSTTLKSPVVRDKLSDLVNDLTRAESERIAVQTEAAINLAVGFVLSKFGEKSIVFKVDEVSQFAKTYQFGATKKPNGDFEYYVRKVKP